MLPGSSKLPPLPLTQRLAFLQRHTRRCLDRFQSQVFLTRRLPRQLVHLPGEFILGRSVSNLRRSVCQLQFFLRWDRILRLPQRPRTKQHLLRRRLRPPQRLTLRHHRTTTNNPRLPQTILHHRFQTYKRRTLLKQDPTRQRLTLRHRIHHGTPQAKTLKGTLIRPRHLLPTILNLAEPPR